MKVSFSEVCAALYRGQFWGYVRRGDVVLSVEVMGEIEPPSWLWGAGVTTTGAPVLLLPLSSINVRKSS